MKTNSRKLLHVGIGLVIAPTVDLNRDSFLRFQADIMKVGLEYDQAQRPSINEILLVRSGPPPLQITVKNVSDQIHQLIVIGTEPELTVVAFKGEIDAIRDAHLKTWPGEQQVVGCDVSLRCLYETDGDHAFRDLWEDTLGQPPKSLEVFGRPILGGGLRFVMPVAGEEPQGAAVEVKIESFLRDTRKLFIDTQFVWQMAPESVEQFDARKRIDEVNEFVVNQVVAFITGGRK